MYFRQIAYTISALLLALCMMSANAANMQCIQDLNGDGYTDALGETAACVSTTGGDLCPIGAANCGANTIETCPLGNYPCNNGSCSVSTTTSGGACSANVIWVMGFPFALYMCNASGDMYATPQDCSNGCMQTTTQTAACTTSTTYSCPLGNYACLNNSGTFQCSANTCQDLSAIPPTTTTVDTSAYRNDGLVDASGQCLDQVMIFAGRGMRCRPPGASTAYRDCCKDSGAVMFDSVGTLSEYQLGMMAITAVYDAAVAAYAAYSAYQAAGMGAVAADGASTAFTNVLSTSIDPTTLAISIAVMVVMEYIANACDQTDMETAMLNGSGYCNYNTTICTEKWFGSCIQRARTFCCFNSKMARIVHEQGRSQLASFNGAAQSDCRGFSPEEFQHLDFSKIDFSEYYDDLKTQSQSLIKANVEQKTQDFYNKLQ